MIKLRMAASFRIHESKIGNVLLIKIITSREDHFYFSSIYMCFLCVMNVSYED